MSTRVFLEVNLDYLHNFPGIEYPEGESLGLLIYEALRSSGNPPAERARNRLKRDYGVKVLTSRHHSDAATLNVNGCVAWTEGTKPKRATK
jgi:hypothetical protein